MRSSRFFRRKQWDEERARELDAYLEMETQEDVARGMPLEQARHTARRKLGNLTLIREEIYQMLAHELCSPVARIQVALGILEQRAEDRHLDYITGCAKR